MATDWSEEAKARRSASAKKAAETRKANKEAKLAAAYGGGKPMFKADAHAEKPTPNRYGIYHAVTSYPYIQNSRVARWALSGVSLIAMMRGASYIRWGRHPHNLYIPQRG